MRAENLRIEGQTTKFDITTAWSVIKIETSLKGQFNVENILAAVCVFIAFWIDPKKIPEMIKDVTWIPGRMEKVENDIWADIYVDYA